MNRRRLLYFNPILNLKKPNHPINYNETQSFKTNLFMKYFPKYTKEFSLSTKNASTKSKVKRMKIIRSFNAFCLSRSPEWRLLLSNKLKTLKMLDNGTRSPIQLIEKIKLFKNLDSIKFSFPSVFSSFPSNQRVGEEDSLIEACRKMERLKKLQTLKLDNLSKSSTNFIRELNISSRRLNSLQNLGISCDWKGGRDIEILETIKCSKYLLRKVTSLRLGALCSSSHHRVFKSLANLCPNLNQLSIEFCCRDIIYNPMKARRFSSQCFPVEVNYLETIKTFQNLRSLRLSIADTFTFLKDFTCPPLIENLCLNLEECLSKEIMCQIDKEFTDQQSLKVFEENPTLIRFYDNFENLHEFKTFQVFFSSECNPEDYKYQNYLFQQVLKRTPSLKRFSFIGVHGCWGLTKHFWNPVRDSYLPQLLESCHHFGQELQSLEIGHEKIIFSKLDLSSSRNKFTNLSTIRFTGRFENPDIDIHYFLEQTLSLGGSITTIKLNTFVNGTIVSLLSLLRQLSELKKPRNLSIELQIKLFEPKDIEDTENNFEDAIKELQENHKKLQGISLGILMNSLSSSEYLKEFLGVYGKKFEKFNILSPSAPFSSFEINYIFHF